QGAVADRDAGGRREPAGGRNAERHRQGQGRRHPPLDLRRRRDHHAARPQACHRHRGAEAHRPQPRPDARGGDGRARRLRPVGAAPNAIVKAKDGATIRSTFADAETITRLDGKPASAIEVKKRIGANIAETIEGAKAVADAFVKTAPQGMEVTYPQDKSVFVNQLLTDLQNHVMIAVILVFIVILYALSGRASLLIGLAIPSSFLMG